MHRAARVFSLAAVGLLVITAALIVSVRAVSVRGGGSSADRYRFSLSPFDDEDEEEREAESATLPSMTTPPGSADVEQRAMGTKPAAMMVTSFEGLGVGFEGP